MRLQKYEFRFFAAAFKWLINFEARNPKQIPITKFECSKRFEFRTFEFRISNLLDL